MFDKSKIIPGCMKKFQLGTGTCFFPKDVLVPWCEGVYKTVLS